MANKRRVVGLIVGLAVGGLFLWLALRDINFERFKAALLGANYWWIAPYLGMVLVSTVFRTLRWQLLLRPMGRSNFWWVMHVTNVGTMAVMLLPMRLGEFVRPYLVSDRYAPENEIRMSAALATVVVERILDGLVVTALFFTGVVLAGEAAGPIRYLGYLGGGIFISALTFLFSSRICSSRAWIFGCFSVYWLLRAARSDWMPVRLEARERSMG